MSKASPVKLEPYPFDETPNGTPQVTELHYDVWTLRITLDFEEFDGVVYVDFPSVCGFRVLDEGDLVEMWESQEPEREWLYVVRSHGWLSQEKVRSGFTTDPEVLTEFLVVGINDCISVMATDEPTVTVIDSDG